MAIQNQFVFEIEPFKGVGPIRFGMHKQDVAHAFTCVYRSFFKTSENKYRSDDNEVVGIISHYNDEGLVKHIEIYLRPLDSKTEIYFQGQNITAFSMKQGYEFFSKFSKNITKDHYGYIFHDLGIFLFRYHWENEEDDIEAIQLASALNYWNY